jgi:hypothetical protein
MNLVLLTYEEMKAANQLKKMVDTIANGDGCLTARLGRIAQLRSEFQGLNNVADTDILSEKIVSAATTALSETMGALAFTVENSENYIKSLTVDDLLKEKDILIENFALFTRSERGKPFREFLVSKGIASDVDDVDWKKSIDALIQLPEFATWIEQSKPIALSFI